VNVLALVPHPAAGASTRYRVHQFRSVLAARGIDVTVRPLLDEPAFARVYRRGEAAAKARDLFEGGRRRLADVRAAGRFDAVMIHRELWPLHGLVHETLLRRANPRWLFDLDDAVWLPNVSEANRGVAFLKAPGKARWIAGHSRAVSAGNRHLAEWARAHVRPGAEVFHVPTAVDTERFRSARGRGAVVPGSKACLVGWIGSASTAPYLAAVREPLARLCVRHPGLRLRVIGARVQLPGVAVESVPWSLETEVQALDGLDIAIAPLPDDAWARGKCGLKVLQSMAMAKPVVTSPTGAHLDLVEDGVSGRFARTPAEWLDALEELVVDPAARRRLGAAGRAVVEERYSVAAVAPALEAALRHAAGGS
jgi:glycosyltransferase involved in cell wall biosynthesis